MLRKIMEFTLFQNRVSDYLLFLSIFLGGIILVQIFKRIFVRRLQGWVRETANSMDDFLVQVVNKMLVPLFYFGFFYLGAKQLVLTEMVKKGIDIFALVLITYLGVQVLLAFIDYGLRNFWLKKGEDSTREKSLKGILPAIKVMVWLLGLVFLLDNLGFKISTVVAGLGIGGIAVAMAAQAMLKDLFSYFAILFDRPFEVGDFVIVGEYMGTIEHVGIKTTRLRSLGGEQLVFSNSDLTDSRLRNYKRMQKRRVLFTLGVTYETDLEKLREIPGIIKNIIVGMENAEFDRAHFASYGDFSLNVEIVYYILNSDYYQYMDIQEKINLAIREEFDRRGIEFAYPTQTLHISKDASGN